MITKKLPKNGATDVAEVSPRARPARFSLWPVLRAALLVVTAAGICLAVYERWVARTDDGVLRAHGTLEAPEVTLSSEVTARVRTVPFDEGQTVRRGDILVQLDDSLPQIRYHQADPADQQVVAVELAAYAVRAPRDGVILSRSVEPGEIAVAGAPLLVIADLANLDLTAYVLQRDLPRIAVGQQAHIDAEAFPGESFLGQVTAIADKAEFTPRNVETSRDRLNLVFAVKIRIPNPDRHLRPGMTVTVRFEG